MIRRPDLPPALDALVRSRGFAQLVRFAVAGLGLTLFSAAVYLLLAMPLGIRPMIANTLSYSVGLVVAYFVHSRWSFQAAGRGEEGAMLLRFLAVCAISFALNSLWVWIATVALHLSPLAPVPGMVFVTPLVSFALNRWWVFRAA